MEILGEPNYSYWYGNNEYDDENNVDIKDRYSKDGFPYLIVEFDDFTIKYEVKYHVNDEKFFDYIEFVEVEK